MNTAIPLLPMNKPDEVSGLAKDTSCRSQNLHSESDAGWRVYHLMKLLKQEYCCCDMILHRSV